MGIVTGVTTGGGGLFGRLRGLDWLCGLGLGRLPADYGGPVAAVGNSILATRAAYESVGGYEALSWATAKGTNRPLRKPRRTA